MNYLKTFLPYLFGNKKGKSLDISLPSPIPWKELCFEETLMFHTLQNSINQYIRSLNFSSLSRKEIFHLFNFLSFIDHDLKNSIELFFKDELILYNQSIKNSSPTIKEIQELLDFKNQQLTVFALLKKDRTKPGVLIVRAANGRFSTNKDQSIWSIPVLGCSGRGLSFNHSNGCTPTGVFSLDSVMPLADKNFEFGERLQKVC